MLPETTGTTLSNYYNKDVNEYVKYACVDWEIEIDKNQKKCWQVIC